MKVTLLRKEYSDKEIFENVIQVNYEHGLVFIRTDVFTKVIPISSIITLTEYK